MRGVVAPMPPPPAPPADLRVEITAPILFTPDLRHRQQRPEPWSGYYKGQRGWRHLQLLLAQVPVALWIALLSA